MNLLTSGIKNALERGSDLNSAINSFKNAGYSQEEIDKAVIEIKSWPQFSNSEQENLKENNQQEVSSIQKGDKTNQIKKLPKQFSSEGYQKKEYFGYVMIILIGLLFIAGAALFGLYWDKLFS